MTSVRSTEVKELLLGLVMCKTTDFQTIWGGVSNEFDCFRVHTIHFIEKTGLQTIVIL